jgi:predicted cobalt transporter CbtA
MVLFNKNMLSGLAGAIVLNVVHQLAKKINKNAPHVDKIGEEAVSKSIKKSGYDPPKGDRLFLTTLVGDVIANSIYYSLIGKGKKENLLLRGIIFGGLAGLGALKLTKPMGLDDQPVNKTNKTKAMTIAWYIIGGLATVYALKLLEKDR